MGPQSWKLMKLTSGRHQSSTLTFSVMWDLKWVITKADSICFCSFQIQHTLPVYMIKEQQDELCSLFFRDDQCSAAENFTQSVCAWCTAFSQYGIHCVRCPPWGIRALAAPSSCVASSGLRFGCSCLLRSLRVYQPSGGCKDSFAAPRRAACTGILSETLPRSPASPLVGGPHRWAPGPAEGTLSWADLSGCDEWREAGLLLLLWNSGYHVMPRGMSAVRGWSRSSGRLHRLTSLPGRFNEVFNWLKKMKMKCFCVEVLIKLVVTFVGKFILLPITIYLDTSFIQHFKEHQSRIHIYIMDIFKVYAFNIACQPFCLL